jgi:hypothetical protein
MAELAGRAYWRLSDAAKVQGYWRASGLSLAEFCREWGLKRGKVDRWWRMLREEEAQQQVATSMTEPGPRGFVEWFSATPESKASRASSEATCPDGEAATMVVVEVGRLILRCPRSLSEAEQRAWLRSALEVVA